MEDPQIIAGRVRDITQKAVNDATGVAIEAFQAINRVAKDDGVTPPKYTSAHAIKSMTQLANTFLEAGISLARIPLRVEPDRNTMLLADNIASVVGRGLTQTLKVATDASARVDANTYNKDQWVNSAVELTSIAMLRTAEVAEAVAAGPGVYRDPTLRSDPFEVPGDASEVRRITLMNLGRPYVTGEDISAVVGFDPANRMLMPGISTFRLVANSAGIASGVYVGKVKVESQGAAGGAATTVEVAFAL